MTKKKQAIKDHVVFNGEKLTLHMPRGRKGKDGVINAQKPLEELMLAVNDAQGNEAELLAVSRRLFEYPGFQDEIMPFILMHTDKEFSNKTEALAYWDDNTDPTLYVMFQYMNAMNYFMTGANPDALQEAMGK